MMENNNSTVRSDEQRKRRKTEYAKEYRKRVKSNILVQPSVMKNNNSTVNNDEQRKRQKTEYAKQYRKRVKINTSDDKTRDP